MFTKNQIKLDIISSANQCLFRIFRYPSNGGSSSSKQQQQQQLQQKANQFDQPKDFDE